jgi:hypothetical protein
MKVGFSLNRSALKGKMFPLANCFVHCTVQYIYFFLRVTYITQNEDVEEGYSMFIWI